MKNDAQNIAVWHEMELLERCVIHFQQPIAEHHKTKILAISYYKLKSKPILTLTPT